MYELAYCSISAPSVNSEEVDRILEVSRISNAEKGITGCLLYHKNQFAQILEGEKMHVLKLFGIIQKDPRHTNVKLIFEGEKPNRDFDNWSMAYQELGLSNPTPSETQLFESKLLSLSALADDTSTTRQLFWKKVKQIILESAPPPG